MPRDIPILFSGPMVRAQKDDRKSQTRRLETSPLAKVQPGDRLWVRERTLCLRSHRPMIDVRYEADGEDAYNFPLPDRVKDPVAGKRLSMGCYRELSRLTLVVQEVRFMLLQDISEEDALAEGCPAQTYEELAGMDARGWFRDLWDSLHGSKRGERWDDNPRIVALTFQVHRCNIDRLDAHLAALEARS